MSDNPCAKCGYYQYKAVDDPLCRARQKRWAEVVLRTAVHADDLRSFGAATTYRIEGAKR